jgi:hypothetical protein
MEENDRKLSEEGKFEASINAGLLVFLTGH